MEAEREKGKTKAEWDLTTHAIFVDLAVQQLWEALLRGETGIGWDTERQTIDASSDWWETKLQKFPDAAKFRVKGLEHSLKLDELFQDVTATGANSWALTSGTMPLLYNQPPTMDDNVDEGEHPEESEHEETKCKNDGRALNQNKKVLNKRKKQLSTSKKLSRQLDKLYEAVKNRDSYIRIGPPECSIKEVLNKLSTLPGCEKGSQLFNFGVNFFVNRAYREVFVALEDPESQLAWLNAQYIKSSNADI
ncbi:L10-interacting MYB domain-containing protein-like [Cornus florida]|uniref:L10-interacting MYB domain-containing protein-like n=1 Tax=Cornus florida TaxID=4283 RepID=UPI00289FC70E|nr:L10-interacting MYB domain-containing protein-like [Cornus florida]